MATAAVCIASRKRAVLLPCERVLGSGIGSGPGTGGWDRRHRRRLSRLERLDLDKLDQRLMYGQVLALAQTIGTLDALPAAAL